MIWFILAVTASLLDGILTYVGVSRWGPDVEANPLIYRLILHWGLIPALVFTRIVAIGLFAALWHTKHTGLLMLLAALSLFVAVLPWTYILWRYR